ncbi:uncharacterized protein LOC100203833 isoform X33 [Hydra vulgaris]|uniref:Uncharacterized protein LOC100203833 isoform X33 n=1 Tax=Hydra vulgaris TaxID=6087 RepID=A0ABM4B745_HYDVU
MTHTKNHLYKKWWPLIILMLQQLRGDVKSSCRITNIISGYYLKSGINQPNIKKLGESDNLALCKKLSCKEDIYDFGLFDGKQCYGILCLHNTDKRCMLKRDGNADYTIFKIHAQSSPKRKKHDRYHSTKKNGYQISNNSLQIPLKNKFVGNRTFIIQSHRTTNVHKENKQLHRKHKKRREKRKAQIDAGKHAVFQNMFLYNNQTELLTKKQLTKKPYFSTLTSLNPNFKLVSYSKPFNVYGFSTNQQNPPKKLLVVNPSSNEVSYSMPSFVSKEVPSQNPALINSYIHPETLSNGEKMLYSFTYPPLTNNYNKDLSTANFVIQESLSNSSNLLGESNVNKRMNIDSTAFSSFNEDQHQPFLNNLTKSNNLSEKKDNLIIPPVQNEIVQKAVQSSNYGSQNFNNRKGIISDVQPLRDFPTDTDLAVEEKDIIPSPDELRKLDDQTMAAKDSVIDIPFSSKNQLQDLPVLQKGLFNASKHTQAQTSNATLTRLYTPKKTYQVLLQQRKITGHSLYHHIPSISHTEESVVSDTDKKEPKFITENSNVKSTILKNSNVKSNILKSRFSSINNRDMVPRPSENIEKLIPENFQKSEVQRLLGPLDPFSFPNNFNPSNSSILKFGNIHNVTSETDDTDEYMMLDAQHLGFQTAISNDHNKNYDILNSGCVNPIGISQPALIKDFQFSASSSMENFPPSKARLLLKENGEEYSGSWCSSANSKMENMQPFLQVDLRKRTMFCRLAIQGDDNVRKWVKKFKVHYSDDGVKWDPYSEEGVAKIFMGNEDEKDITFRTLKNPVIARYVRFKPIQWEGDSPCMRVEMFNAGVQGLDNSVLRSTIPSVHFGLVVDLDFEKMDELIALDKSSFGNNGFLHGGAKIFDTHSSCRHAVQIPIGSDIVIDGSVMKVHPRKAISIALWIQLNRVDGVHSIFDTVGRNSKHNLGQFHFEIVGGDVRWFHRNETESEIFNLITEQKLIKSHEWNHIAATYDSKTGATIIYINGTEQVRGKGQGLISKDWSEHVGIGQHKGVRFLDGQIDEFKIYDSAITAEHVDELASKCDFSRYYCGQTLTEETGSIFSPSYPDTQNGPVECVWNIQGDIGETVSLDMSQFKLGYKSDCGKGNLEVRDKNSVIGVYCGASITPRRILSHSNQLTIKYSTDGAFTGEKFRIDFKVNRKKTKKNSVNHQCVASKTIGNVTLVGGVKAGNFTDLGSVSNMEDCKNRCCNLEECQVAFLIDDSCYAVKCARPQLCQPRRAKSTALYPQLLYIKNRIKLPFLSDPTDPNINPSESDIQPHKLCPHDEKLVNVTLVGGIKSGNFTSHGTVQNFEECLQYCCLMNNCDLAFMVKQTCFSLKCANSEVCTVRPARPSVYNPTVAFIKRNKALSTFKVPTVSKVPAVIPKVLPIESNKAACKDIRLSKVHHGVTLSGGINAGEFTDKGHVETMDECVERCCSSDSCNVAFVIKDTCFAVKCKSYNDCNLKSAMSEYYNPRIVFVNWSPPKDLGESVPYLYEGCWHDFDISAFALPLLEGTSPILNTLYKKRQDPVNDCSSVSQSRGYKVFAIQNGGACFSGPNAEQTYKRYGKSDACKEGKGGPFANSVYKLFDDGSVIALGCWADLQDRSFRRMESNDPLLFDSFESRADPIGTCARVATKMKIKYFAMQKGGQCFVAKDKQKVNYNRYSPSRKCKYGLGGPMANDVYMLKLTEIAVKDKTCKAISEHNNVTFIAGINAGNFSDMGHTTTMDDCKARCCHDKDCNIAFKIEDDCYGVRCYSKSSCQMRPAKNAYLFNPQMAVIRKINDSLEQAVEENITAPLVSLKIELTTTVSPQTTSSLSTTMKKCSGDLWDEEVVRNSTLVGGINAGTFRDHGQVDSIGECMEYCCSESDCDLSFMIDQDCYTVKCYSESVCLTRKAKPTAFTTLIAYKKAYKIGTTPSSTFMFSSATNVATPSFGSPKEHSCKADPIIFNATLRMGMHSGLFTKLGRVKQMDDCIERCCHSSNADVAYMLGPFCFAVKCKTKEMCKPSPAMYSDIKSLNLNPAISFLNKPGLLGLSGQSQTNNNEKGVCADSPINYNVTLRGGVHSGKFIELGEGINMRECVSKCCDTPLCDVAFMFSDKCYAVGCFDEASCQAVIAKPSNLNPKLAYVTKYRPNTVLSLDSATSGILFDINNENPKTCDPETIEHGPIHVNKTLSGGMKYGYYSYLGKAYDIKSCLSKCCESGKCDMAYLVNKEQCFSVKCLTPELCEIRDHPFKNKWIEISALVKSSETKKKKYQAVSVLPLLLVSLVVMTAGLTGLIWAILIFVRRHKTKKQNEKSNDDEDDGIPRPER